MGNEGSVPFSYGKRLLNDVKVRWTNVELRNLPCVDGHCSSTAGSKLYVFGGVRWDDSIEDVVESNDTYIFDNGTQSWSKAEVSGDIPSARSSSAMATVDSKIYLFGGLSRETGWLNDMYSLDTETLEWSSVHGIGTSPSPRDKLCCSTFGSKIYFFGGFGPLVESNSEEAEFQWFNDIFTFDTETCMWKKLNVNDAPSPRAAHTMCLINRNLVVFGGRDSISRQHDLYTFNLESLTWNKVNTSGRQPEPRSFHACTTVGQRMIVFGGRGIQDQHYNDVHIFDMDTKEWFEPEVSGDVPSPRGLHILNIVDDKIILFGGSSDFDKEAMQLQTYHNDTFLIDKVQIMVGKVTGEDPYDVSESSAGATLGTIEECDKAMINTVDQNIGQNSVLQ